MQNFLLPTATTMSAELFDPFEGKRGFRYSGSVRAVYPLSPKTEIPSSIRRPNYRRESLFPSRRIRVNLPADQEGVRRAAILARESLDTIAAAVRPGITTDELDKLLVQAAVDRGCYPSPLGYHGYPKSVCTSVNEVICHGIPDQRVLQDGDLINLDVTLYHNGFHGDVNATYPVGEKARQNEATMRLIRTARACLDAAIAICGPGMPYAEIGYVVKPIATKNGCAVVKNYTGHGIGRVFHGPPTIYHHPTKKARCRRPSSPLTVTGIRRHAARPRTLHPRASTPADCRSSRT